MKITDSNSLLQHMATGSSFRVKNDELHTLSGPAKNWDRILQHFRSSQTLAMRETRVLSAMTEMLRPQASSGPSNLASPNALTQPQIQSQTPAEALNTARMEFMNTMLEEALTRVDKQLSGGEAVSFSSLGNLSQDSTDASTGIYEDMDEYATIRDDTLQNAEDIYDSPRSTPASAGRQSYQEMAEQADSSADRESVYDAPRSAKTASSEQTTDTESSYQSPRSSLAPSSETVSSEDALYDVPRRGSDAFRVPLHSGEKKLLHAALSSALCDPVLLGTSSLAQLRTLVESAATQAIINHVPGSLSNLFTGFTQDTRALIDRQEVLTRDVNVSLNGALKQSGLFKDDLCVTTQRHFHLDRPRIDGVSIAQDAGSPESINKEYEALLESFSASPAEKRVLSYLMGPDGRLPVDAILDDARFPASVPPLNPNVAGQLSPQAPTLVRSPVTPAEGFCALSRNGNGDTVLEFNIPLAPSGQIFDFTLNNGQRLEVRANERAPVAQLSYTIIVNRMEDNVIPAEIPMMLLGMTLKSSGEARFRSGPEM